MTESDRLAAAQRERELGYYRRECNDLGARLLRAQEEQSHAFREARRSRTVAKLIREAYRLADQGATPAAIGAPMLEIILENTLCDRAALLLRTEPAPGNEGARFRVTHSMGAGGPAVGEVAALPAAPDFFFTTARTALEPPAYELTAILRVPYVLWCHDRATGHALILGNQSEGNVSRPFEPADQELIEGALSVYIDVALRKQAELELRSAKAAAEEASAVRARFLATLSHELRTPLNAIIGFSEMIAPASRPDPAPAERRQYAAQILESGRNLLELINAILDYSGLAQAAPYLDLGWYPPAPLVDAVIAELAPLAAGRGLTLERGAAPPGLLLCIDRLRFRQVLNNLIGNALKFTPPGGRVDIGIAITPEGGARIDVADTGIGMRAEDVPRALEPFQQIEGGLARGFPGAGLGLPIAKGLTEAHGARLELRSAPGVGTTVTVLLPPDRVRLRGTAVA